MLDFYIIFSKNFEIYNLEVTSCQILGSTLKASSHYATVLYFLVQFDCIE